MYSDWSVFAGLAVTAIFIWLLGLTYFIWQQGSFLKSLFPKSGERDIRKKFEEVLDDIGVFKKDLGEVKNKLAELEGQGQIHMQKVALLRYNPYEDTGGDQSFTLAFLDDSGTGIVVTSLHARSGTRVFAKPVLEGKSGKYQFSKEEEQVVEKAMKKR